MTTKPMQMTCAGDHADASARQRPIRRDLRIAPPVDDVVEAHPKAVQPDGNQHEQNDLSHRRPLAVRGVGDEQLRLTVRDSGEDQRHPRELEDGQQSPREGGGRSKAAGAGTRLAYERRGEKGNERQAVDMFVN